MAKLSPEQVQQQKAYLDSFTALVTSLVHDVSGVAERILDNPAFQVALAYILIEYCQRTLDKNGSPYIPAVAGTLAEGVADVAIIAKALGPLMPSIAQMTTPGGLATSAMLAAGSSLVPGGYTRLLGG